MPLREVLDAFEQAGPLSLAQLATRLDADEMALEGMLRFWVNKGRLREAGSQGCTACDVQHGCPVLMNMPRRYELVIDDAPRDADLPLCHSSRY